MDVKHVLSAFSEWFSELFSTKQTDMRSMSEERKPLPIHESTPLGKCCLEPAAAKFIVFYDIDGVCHPGESESLSKIVFLEELCRRVENVRLVMSSTWRYSIDWSYYESKFPPTIRKRTIGFTPIVKASSYRREAEVMAFVNAFQVTKFLCLDDQSKLFQPNWRHLYVVNGSEGLTAEDMENIIQRIMALTKT